ncbi:hypothetical protein K3G63_03855 [Hymenobacter sp. HSC-4F20]|uniref:hypothetical protein n=1 Tax=Hymenobacter sp. HSC-4F20 TaxID=2864135 RepID=UPI001C72DDEC|nr:hypothetical protein [Hymenobacter sp. HSC-4F20]MBX0289556.1 hypothetical protein [Hymenobacter sp. HSC-4F20]
MDTAATLAFFQNFYTDAPLYVVAEPTAAPLNTPEATAPATPAAAPTPAPAATPPPNVPGAPAPPPTPALSGKLPSLSNLPLSGNAAPAAAAASAAPVAERAPVAPVASAPTPPAAAEPSRQAVTLTVAQLPAAAAAPAGRVQPTPTQSPVAHIPFSTLGSNPNGLVILVRVSPDEFRKLPRNVFLNNLLKAIRLIVEDVVLVNVEHPSYPVALCSLRQHLAARQFLAFGKNLLDVAVYTTQPYEPVLLFGDTAFLGASEISMLEYDAGRKKQLWQAVQRMFMS